MNLLEEFGWQKECVRWRASQGEIDPSPCEKPCQGCAERSIHEDLPRLIRENAELRAIVDSVQELLDQNATMEQIREVFAEKKQEEELIGSW